MVDVNRTEGLLLVRSLIFLGAPHRGLEITALQTLVQGTSSESVISELKEGSSVLEILDHDFERYFRGSSVQILTCYESHKTPTVKKVYLSLVMSSWLLLIQIASLLMAPGSAMETQ